MAKQIYENNASSFLSTALGGTSSDTLVTIILSDADKFPSPVTPDEFFVATIENVRTKEWEIVRVNQKNNNQFTVIRNQEGSGIKSFPIGSKFQMRVTKETLERLYSAAIVPTNFVYEQTASANSWTINHNLNKYPSVDIQIGSFPSGSFVAEASAEADIEYTSLDTLIITFSENTTGRAICT